MTIFTHLFFWPRYIIGWSFFFTACAANFIILLGTDAKKIPMWKIELGRFFIKYCSWESSYQWASTVIKKDYTRITLNG